MLEKLNTRSLLLLGNKVKTAPVLNVLRVAGVFFVPDQMVEEPKTVDNRLSLALFQTT